jgi:hypothetical protein
MTAMLAAIKKKRIELFAATLEETPKDFPFPYVTFSSPKGTTSISTPNKASIS